MDQPKRELAIFYFEGTRVFFYEDTLPSMLQLNFPPDILSDLEVISKEKLQALVQAFFQANNIQPAEIIILFAPSATFERDFPDLPIGQIDKDVQTFLDYVPFDNPLSKVMKLEKKWKVIAVNNEFVETVRNAFSKQQSNLIEVVPLSVLQEIFPELASSLNLHLVLEKAPSIKQYSLLGSLQDMMTQNTTQQQTQTTQKSKKNLRPFILIVVFVALLMVLAVMVYMNFIYQPPVQPKLRVVTPPAQQNR